MIEFGEFEKKFLKRWAIIFGIGCLVVSIFIKGDLVGLVRAGGAPMNKYMCRFYLFVIRENSPLQPTSDWLLSTLYLIVNER